jgi:DNA-binding transcriptional MerR regulator
MQEGALLPNGKKSTDAFRTISEVADDLGVEKHVLRFWEQKFTQLKPMKRGGGRRFYRPEDVDLLRGIQHLLHGEAYTIKGVQKILRQHGAEFVKTCWQPERSAAVPSIDPADREDAAGPAAVRGGAARRSAKARAQGQRSGDALAREISSALQGMSDEALSALKAAVLQLEQARSILTQTVERRSDSKPAPRKPALKTRSGRKNA